MKKYIAILAATLVASSALAAELTLPQDKTLSNKVQNVLENKLEQTQKQQPAQIKTLKGTILKGSFTDGFLRVKQFKAKNFSVLFYLANGTVNKSNDLSGDIAFAITGEEAVLKQLSVETDVFFEEGPNGDPDTNIDLSLSIKQTTASGVEETRVPNFTSIILKDLKNDASFTDTPKTVITSETVVPQKVVMETYKVHKADCKDQYHCDCPTVTKPVVVNKQLEPVKIYSKDCHDQYHCDCPSEMVYR